MFLVLLPMVAGVVWYESRPTTVKVPVETEDTEVVIPTYEETIPEPTTTTTTVPKPRKQFGFAGLHLQVRGEAGDDVNLAESFTAPKPIDELPADIQDVVRSCSGVTDRDMVVRVQSQVELTSSLLAKISVDYQTTGMMGVFEFTDGPSCQSDGRVSHELHPGRTNLFTYWLIIPGYITPEHPDGDITKTWYIDGPVLTLPNLELMRWKLWGANVSKCDGLFGGTTHVHIAGYVPADEEGCQPAFGEDQAAGNF